MTDKVATKSAPVDDVVKVHCSGCKAVFDCVSEALFQCAGDGCERGFCEKCAAKMPTSNTCEDCGCDHKSSAPGVNEYADGCMECDCDCVCDSMPSMVICKVCQRIAKREEEDREADKKQLEEEYDEEREAALGYPDDITVEDIDASEKRTNYANLSIGETVKEIRNFRKLQPEPLKQKKEGEKKSKDKTRLDYEGEPFRDTRIRPQDLFPDCNVFDLKDLDASTARTGKKDERIIDTLKEIQEFRKSKASSKKRAHGKDLLEDGDVWPSDIKIEDIEESWKRWYRPLTMADRVKEIQTFRKSMGYLASRGTKRSSDALNSSSSSSSSSSTSSAQSPSKKAKPAKQGSKKVT